MRALPTIAAIVFAACSSSPSSPVAVVGEVTLAVTSPTPGAEIVGEGETIEVTGTVATTSDSDVLDVWINGLQATVSGGEFSLAVPVTPGINHLAVEASDGFVLASQALDVLYAGDYLAPADGTASYDVADAIELRLGQRFFDGRRYGSDLDLTTDPVVADDLAEALELVLHHVDFQALLPPRIQFGEGDTMLDVAIGAVTPQRLTVDARIVDGAVELYVDFIGVALPMTGEFRFGNRTMIIAGGITADLHASARLALAALPDGTIDVEAASVVARVGPLVPAFTGPDGDELDALVTIGESDFRRVIEGLMAEELVPTFTERVPPLLEQLLGSLGELLSDTSFELDTMLGGGPVTVQLSGRVGGLDVVPGSAIGTSPGHVTVRQQLAIVAEGTPIHTASLGAPRLAATPVRPTGNASGIDLALRLDLLNALLHSMWNRGLLEGTAMAGGFTAGVSAKLPPVVRAAHVSSSCRIDDAPCDVALQLGQLELHLADFEQTFAVNAIAGARIVVDGNTVSIKIQEIPELTVWEVSAIGDGRLTPEAVRDLIASVVWPELFGALGDNLSITLPLPDLSTLGLDDVAPGLAGAELQLAVRPRPTVSGGYVSLGADVRLAAPPPP